MKRLIASIAMSSLAAAARAGPAPNLSLEFSMDMGGLWVPDVMTFPGNVVWVRVIMSIPDSFYGISGARYNITSNAGYWDYGCDDTVDLTPGKGSATDGRLAGFDFGGQTQQIFETGNQLRIDAKGDTGNNPNAGISTSQNSPGALGTNFNTHKVAEVYRFAINIPTGHDKWKEITLRIMDGGVNGSPGQITSFKGYETSGSTAGTAIAGVTGDTGTISLFPAPSSAALLGLAGLAAARRRR